MFTRLRHIRSQLEILFHLGGMARMIVSVRKLSLAVILGFDMATMSTNSSSVRALMTQAILEDIESNSLSFGRTGGGGLSFDIVSTLSLSH